MEREGRVEKVEGKIWEGKNMFRQTSGNFRPANLGMSEYVHHPS